MALATPHARPRRSRNPAGQPTVDDDRFAGDVVVRDKQRDDLGNLLGGAFAVERDTVLEVQLFAFGCHVGVETRADDAWSNAVDANVVIGQISCKRTSKLRYRALGRGI